MPFPSAQSFPWQFRAWTWVSNRGRDRAGGGLCRRPHFLLRRLGRYRRVGSRDWRHGRLFAFGRLRGLLLDRSRFCCGQRRLRNGEIAEVDRRKLRFRQNGLSAGGNWDYLGAGGRPGRGCLRPDGIGDRGGHFLRNALGSVTFQLAPPKSKFARTLLSLKRAALPQKDAPRASLGSKRTD